MAQPYKICPICNSPNHQNSTICQNCGTTLTKTNKNTPENKTQTPIRDHNQTEPEADLLEKNLHWKKTSSTLTGFAIIGPIICISTLILLNIQPTNSEPPNQNTQPPTTSIPQEQLSTTNNTTPQPTTKLATVTQGPPTTSPSPLPTTIPTQGPCTQEVLPNDDLISILFRCGHRDLEPIMSTVIALNNLKDATYIQQGQTIEVPWPTPTTDPNLTPPSDNNNEPNNQTTGNSTTISSAMTPGVKLIPTETLQPGVTWHTIQKDENIIMIAVEYGATLRILSELNPEVTFSQCDFGLGTGGPNCNVQIFEGQKIRVPAPTATPTIQPTPSGSETPTPTATATFNAPTILGPSDRAFFDTNTLVTLRWVTTGALGADDIYLILVKDTTSNKTYSATTHELSFIVPQEWQGQDNSRHEYTWKVSVINTNYPDKPYFTTEDQLFIWQGRGNS